MREKEESLRWEGFCEKVQLFFKTGLKEWRQNGGKMRRILTEF